MKALPYNPTQLGPALETRSVVDTNSHRYPSEMVEHTREVAAREVAEHIVHDKRFYYAEVTPGYTYITLKACVMSEEELHRALMEAYEAGKKMAVYHGLA